MLYLIFLSAGVHHPRAGSWKWACGDGLAEPTRKLFGSNWVWYFTTFMSENLEYFQNL